MDNAKFQRKRERMISEFADVSTDILSQFQTEHLTFPLANSKVLSVLNQRDRTVPI